MTYLLLTIPISGRVRNPVYDECDPPFLEDEEYEEEEA